MRRLLAILLAPEDVAASANPADNEVDQNFGGIPGPESFRTRAAPWRTPSLSLGTCLSRISSYDPVMKSEAAEYLLRYLANDGQPVCRRPDLGLSVARVLPGCFPIGQSRPFAQKYHRNSVCKTIR
jgi:hypothetical protein